MRRRGQSAGSCRCSWLGGLLEASAAPRHPAPRPPPGAVQVLRRTKGAFRLLDVSAELPELKRVPGLQRWRVRDKSDTWFDSWEQGKEVGGAGSGGWAGRGRQVAGASCVC